ncbi:hypothetical protein BVC80_8695g16 [Macleaya cordata]|uniref:Protodermal factor 1 n=1 Tax=Macleaya cordata TaxID=56857 RepID=A0A200PPS3_MACCD|nr:hypothetical protein BVC80_8695g16 [Macleaya cordata]
MERKKCQNSMFLWVLVAVVLVSHQNLVFPGVMCRSTFEDQKNYYSPDPHSGSSHGGGSHKSPSHGSSSPTPSSHGSKGKPSHGSGGSCPPTTTTTPSPPKHSGGYHYSPPTTVSPPTPIIVSPPTTGGGSPPVIIGTPPSTPADPDISSPPTPLIPNDPNLPPFDGTCNFWKTHPEAIWGIFGWWASVGGVFGGGVGGVGSAPTSLPTDLSLQQALANTRTDGIGALYREGTASLLNSMVTKKFPFSSQQIKELFIKALESEKAAEAQAELFKKANEGRLKHRA